MILYIMKIQYENELTLLTAEKEAALNALAALAEL